MGDTCSKGNDPPVSTPNPKTSLSSISSFPPVDIVTSNDLPSFEVSMRHLPDNNTTNNEMNPPCSTKAPGEPTTKTGQKRKLRSFWKNNINTRKNRSTNSNKNDAVVDDSPTQTLSRNETSLVRVGSRIFPTGRRRSLRLEQNSKTENNDNHEPSSPQVLRRASNYNHVRDAVRVNFKHAASQSQQQRKGWRQKNDIPLGVAGLANLGNTCYMNSSLQCLSATIPLTDYFLGYNYRSEINQKNILGTRGEVVVAYAELLKQLWLHPSRHQIVRPQAFKRQIDKFAPQFEGNQQHDAQELLSFLLDGIHEDLNRIQSERKPYIEDRDCDGSNDEEDAIMAWSNHLRRDKSLIVDIFQGQLRSQLQCLSCGHVNVRFEPFMYLSLPISAECQSITDCLNLYLSEEQLTGENQWYCSKCKTHRDATKKTNLWVLPPILIVHLKRFRFNDYGQIGSKNSASIEYPVQDWDLSPLVGSRGSEESLYDLYAVSNHHGNLKSGHYTAYSLNRFNDQWYEFNDSNCYEISRDTLHRNTSSAYVLYYNRTTADKGDKVPDERPFVVRRQSVSRPDLWPHVQVQDRDFRRFTRSIKRKLGYPSIPDLSSSASANEEKNS